MDAPRRTEKNPYLGPCHCDREAAAGLDPGPCSSKDYVIPEELAALARMRQLRATARLLRSQLGESPSSDPRQRELSAMLDQAREQFRRCRDAWTAANELKHRRLGHRS